MLFGGLLASRLPRRSTTWGARYWSKAPRYRFGFTGFKPAEAFRYHPIPGGLYKPGDTFVIQRGDPDEIAKLPRHKVEDASVE
jgi:hypothetical protein